MDSDLTFGRLALKWIPILVENIRKDLGHNSNHGSKALGLEDYCTRTSSSPSIARLITTLGLPWKTLL